MNKKIRKILPILTFLLIPIFFFWNPSFITLMGVQPYWVLFWLFPWASIYGSFNGLITGLSLGIILDSLSNDIYSQIPGLIFCGFWFGNLGKNKSKDLNKFKYGLICSIGCFVCNLLYFCQVVFHHYTDKSLSWFLYGIKIISAQIFITGLLAPIICNLLFSLFDRNNINSSKTL